MVADTLRADHLSCYGYERPTSPRIDAFADGATRYTRAISSSSWTLPSHASLFTGLPPFAHGAHAYETDEPVNNAAPLAPEFLTLAEALQSEGYRTGAFVANYGFLGPRWGLDQGFEIYRVVGAYAADLNRLIFPWLSVEDERPFFLFVNYVDSHNPYNAEPRPEVVDPPPSRSKWILPRFAAEVLPDGGSVREELRREVVDQYDTGVAHLDEGFGGLLAELDRVGFAGRTVVVFTSDHGEFFGEHRLVGHAKDVYDPVLRVPLIIRAPGQTAQRVESEWVTSTDVPSLIARHLPASLQQRLRVSFPEAPGTHPVLAESHFSHRLDIQHPSWGHRFRRVRRALFEWPYKYIHSSDQGHELYDLEADPGEQENLLEAKPAFAARFERTLDDYDGSLRRTSPPPALPQLTEEEQEHLRSLGYVGD